MEDLVLQELDRGQMAALMGGEMALEIMPDRSTSLMYDIGWAIGKLVAGAVAVLNTAPVSNYTYCKVGYIPT